jgi:hypothetical protein
MMPSDLSNQEILKRIHEKDRKVRFLTGLGLLGLLLTMVLGTLLLLTYEVRVAYSPNRVIYIVSPYLLVGFAVGLAMFLISILALKLWREVN